LQKFTEITGISEIYGNYGNFRNLRKLRRKFTEIESYSGMQIADVIQSIERVEGGMQLKKERCKGRDETQTRERD
jgi:hypothetical protein